MLAKLFARFGRDKDKGKTGYPIQISDAVTREFISIMYVDPGTSSAEEISDIYEAMSDLNKAQGGNGLTFELRRDLFTKDMSDGVAEDSVRILALINAKWIQREASLDLSTPTNEN